jgi:hypothetical protein
MQYTSRAYLLRATSNSYSDVSMQYFTPELYLRLQQFDAPNVVEQATAEWDNSVREYNRVLEEIRPRLSDGVLAFLDGYCLHDAAIVAMGHGCDPLTYRLLVREDTTQDLIELLYHDAEPSLEDSAFPQDYQTDTPVWLYDELTANPRVLAGWRPLMVHSILLSDGRVLTVRFRDLLVTRFQPFPTQASVTGVA